MRRTATQGRDQRGSATIETVVGLPAFMLFVLLILVGGRLTIAQQAVEGSAAEAARAASISRTRSQAEANGTAGAATSLTNQQLRCQWQRVEVDTAGFAAPVGTPAKVTATVSCVVDVSDVSLPGVPGRYTVTATMSSPVDTYRER